MHNFKCNYEIVEAYLRDEKLSVYHNHDVYDVGMNTPESMFVEPDREFTEEVNELLHKVYSFMDYFKLRNEGKFQKYLPDGYKVEEKFVVNFVVGLPPQVKKIFKGAPDGHIDIIIDLHNYITSFNGILDNNAYQVLAEDIYDYISYAICLLVLDSHDDTNETDDIAVLYHAIYSTSFAFFISESHHLDYMRKTSVYDMWLYLEYDMLKKLRKNKKNPQEAAKEYLHTTIQINPEMIVLGTSGKVLLESTSETDAHKLFEQGPYEFIKNIEKCKKISKKNTLSITNLILTSIIPLVIVAMIILGIVDLVNQRVSLALKILPLVSFGLVLLREVIKHALLEISKYRFYIFSFILIVISFLYAYLVIL